MNGWPASIRLRTRFLILLSELGENSVVFFSTHIVGDVSELCARMAIIDKREILCWEPNH